jgi:hypothetical protein
MRPGPRIRSAKRGVTLLPRVLASAVLLAAPVALITLVVGGPGATPAGASVPRVVHHDDGGGGSGQGGGPILECSYHDTKTGKYNTVWGYTNTTGQSYQVPVGTYNQFNNPGANAGQPTTFLNGIHHNVFIVTHTGSSSWTLGFVTVTAPGTACATNPVPFLPSGVPAWLTIGGLMAVVVAGGLVVQRRLDRATAR